jgi:hypothetical protein
MSRAPAETFYWEGFTAPHYTQVPDEVFDELLPVLSEAELKVLLYIIRRTFGFKKTADAISLRQMTAGIVTADGRRLDYGAGLSERSVIRGIQGLLTKGLILAERRASADRGDESTVYQLRMRSPAGVCQDDSPPRAGKAPRRLATESGANPPAAILADPPVTVADPPADSLAAPPDSLTDHRPVTLAAPPDSVTAAPADSLADGGLPASQTQQTAVQQTEKQQVDSNPPRPENAGSRPRYSPYIAAVVLDVSRELGDPQGPSNVTQALRLWQQSGLDENGFVATLYQAKQGVRQAQAAGVGNKGAYLFAVLRDQLGLGNRAAGAVELT